MRISLFLLFTVLCLAVLPLAAANAQYAPAPTELFDEKPKEEPKEIEPNRPTLPEPTDPNKKPLPFKSYDEIPQEVLDEAKTFYEYCKNDPRLPTHYDCRCWEQRFVEERIRMGPNVPRTAIIGAINRECIDTTAAAGYAYEKCQGNGMSNYHGGMDPEEYCVCVANNYSILLERDKNFHLHGKKTGALFSGATIRCQPAPPPGVANTFPRLDQ